MMLPTIPTPDELLDKGFRRGKKAADLRRGEKMPKHLKGKRIEETRVITACQVIKDRLKMILDRTPEIEELPEFYQDYIDITDVCVMQKKWNIFVCCIKRRKSRCSKLSRSK